MSVKSDEIRRDWKINDEIRDAGNQLPEDVLVHENIIYGPQDDLWQSLNLYQPRHLKGQKTPVIVSVHGGAWVYGDKELYQYYCASLATRGFSVVNFSYRLAPEHPFPAQLEDVVRVFQWVQDQAAAYQFDTNHIYAVGDSAGAHLLGLFCNLCTNPAYSQALNSLCDSAFLQDLTDTPSRIQPHLRPLLPKAVALNCGCYELYTGVGSGSDIDVVSDLLPELSHEYLDLIDVLSYLTPEFPPAYVMTDDGDFLSYQAPKILERLIANNVICQFQYYKNPDFQLNHVFHVNMKYQDAHRCNDDECAFFRRF